MDKGFNKNRKDLLGNLGMYEVATYLTRKGMDITVHGGRCSFDMSDSDGNRYEVKTSVARIYKREKSHGAFRGWGFASGIKNRNIAKFEFTCYVLLNEELEIENIAIIPKAEDRYRNGKTAVFKDTNWQKKYSGRIDMVNRKWYEDYYIYNPISSPALSLGLEAR